MPSAASRRIRPAHLAIGLWAALIGVAALTSLRWPMFKDSPLMWYAASLFRDGASPYRDLFEMTC
jgi:hypothetical protein